MNKTVFKLTIVCATCAILSASSRAQSTPPSPDESSAPAQSTRSLNTKHLTATGRMNEPAIRASKLVGAQVNDMSGNSTARIQDIIVNPHSGRIDFALLSLNGTKANANPNLIPVPWKLLRQQSPAQYSEGSEVLFTLNVDQSKLKGAPTVNSTDLDQSQWRQRIYAYYGVTPQPSAGGTDSDQEETKGEGARSLHGQSPESPTPPQTSPPPNQ